MPSLPNLVNLPPDPIPALRCPVATRACVEGEGPRKTQGQRPPASAPARVGEVPPCPAPVTAPTAPSRYPGAERAGVGLTAASVAVAIAVAARAPGVLYDHALAAQLLAVQLVNGVVRVAGVLELHETVPEEGRSAGRAPAGVSLAGAARSREPPCARSRRRRHFGGPATRRRGLGRLGTWGAPSATGRGPPDATHPFLRSISRRRP